MCTGTTTHADIRVSIQDRNAPDRAAGHLAVAVPMGGDAVLVPNPGPELLDTAAELISAGCEGWVETAHWSVGLVAAEGTLVLADHE